MGENPSIETEVNIEDILHKTKKNYLINIISQELRFDKQTNFYEPLQFNHTRRKPDDGSDDDDEQPTDQPEPTGSPKPPSSDSDGDESKEENKGGISDSTSLALAITLPIVSAIIIIAVVFIIFRRKNNMSENIEKLTN